EADEPSFELQFRVEPNLDDIHDQVADDDQGAVQDHEAKHQGVVAVGGAIDEFPAEARNLEDGLDDKRTGQDAGDRGAHERHHRLQSATQRMLEYDPRFTCALGACRPNEVEIQHLEHAAAGDAHQIGGVHQAESHGWKDPVFGIVPTGNV